MGPEEEKHAAEDTRETRPDQDISEDMAMKGGNFLCIEEFLAVVLPMEDLSLKFLPLI
jgi:hypothetical protein